MRPGPALALLALLALAAGNAAAAPARVGLEFPPLPLLPPGESVSVDGNLTYHYEEPSPNMTEVTLVLASGPEWLSAQIQPGSVLVDASGPEGRTVVPVGLTVEVRPGTMALSQHTLQVRVSAEANPPIEAAEGSTGVVVRVAYAGKLRVEPIAPSVETRPGEPAVIGLRVANEGNGPARVVLQASAPDASVRIVPPGPFLVEASGALQERVVNVSALAERPGTFPLLLRYTNTHAFDATHLGQGGEVTVSLEVREAGLPGPGAAHALLALGLAGLTLLARRARRRGPR